MKRYPTVIAILLTGFLLYFAWLGYLMGSPFTDVRPEGHVRNDLAAVVLSGDMGFKVGMGKQIARRLADDNIAVVGINSLNYFRTTRTPAEATALIARAINRAQTVSHAPRVMLIGQSYGADMLHVGLAGLVPSLRARVALVALVVPGATVEYRASPGEMFTFLMDEADARPTGKLLDWVPVLCVFGTEESNSLCPLLWQRNVHAVSLPGGHPLHYDAGAVYRELRAEMTRAGLNMIPPSP
jgi:type IV secretory pathway VirJ component